MEPYRISAKIEREHVTEKVEQRLQEYLGRHPTNAPLFIFIDCFSAKALQEEMHKTATELVIFPDRNRYMGHLIIPIQTTREYLEIQRSILTDVIADAMHDHERMIESISNSLMYGNAVNVPNIDVLSMGEYNRRSPKDKR